MRERRRYIHDAVTADLAETSSPWNARAAKGTLRLPAATFGSVPRFPGFYPVHLGTGDFGDAGSDTRVLPFAAFCAELALP